MKPRSALVAGLLCVTIVLVAAALRSDDDGRFKAVRRHLAMPITTQEQRQWNQARLRDLVDPTESPSTRPVAPQTNPAS